LARAPKGAEYGGVYFGLSGLDAFWGDLTRGDALASLRACPWLSYSAPLALRHSDYYLVKIKMIRITIALNFILLLTAGNALGQDKPALREIDRIRLAEAFRLSDQLGDELWPGWSKAPLAVLLVTPEKEFLIRHPQPSNDFTPLGYDSKLKSEVFYRDRKFQTSLLATFPAVGGISTIVIGQAENTASKTSAP